MRELTRDEYAPTLSYVAAVLEAGLLVFAYALKSPTAIAALSILLAPVAYLLVRHVHAEPWARIAGFVWAALSGLAGLAALIAIIVNGNVSPISTITGLSLLAAGGWIVGAALADDGGPARALGGAAAAAVALAGLLDIAQATIALTRWHLAGYVQILSIALFVAWLVLLGRDLGAGRRRWKA